MALRRATLADLDTLVAHRRAMFIGMVAKHSEVSHDAADRV